MRRFFLLIVIAGAVLRIGYPWYVSNFTGEAIEERLFYQRGGAWNAITSSLAKDAFPVGLKVKLVVDAPDNRLSQSGDFVLKIRGPGGMSSSEILTFVHLPTDSSGAGAPVQTLWQSATTLQNAGGGDYSFELRALPGGALSVKSASLQLDSGVTIHNGQILLIGAILMGFGGMGFVFTSLGASRKRRLGNGAPPASRWGRDGSDK